MGPIGPCWGGVGGLRVVVVRAGAEGGYTENDAKTGVDDRIGDVGVSSESLNAMLAVSYVCVGGKFSKEPIGRKTTYKLTPSFNGSRKRNYNIPQPWQGLIHVVWLAHRQVPYSYQLTQSFPIFRIHQTDLAELFQVDVQVAHRAFTQPHDEPALGPHASYGQ